MTISARVGASRGALGRVCRTDALSTAESAAPSATACLLELTATSTSALVTETWSTLRANLSALNLFISNNIIKLTLSSLSSNWSVVIDI